MIRKLSLHTFYEGPSLTANLFSRILNDLKHKKLARNEIEVLSVHISDSQISFLVCEPSSVLLLHPIRVYPLSGRQVAYLQGFPVDRTCDWWGCDEDLEILKQAPSGLF